MNVASRVADGEELRVPAVWGIELFGPNESERLYQALDALEWGNSGFSNRGDNASSWARQQRAYGYGGTYTIGHVIRRSDAHRFFAPRNFSALPQEADYILVHLHQVVPSITCVMVCFVLKEEVSAWYERELNRDRVSYLTRARNWGVAQHDPAHLKRQAIDDVRAKLRHSIHHWFRRNLPGYFSRSPTPLRLPMAELLHTKTEDALGNLENTSYLNWRRIVSKSIQRDVWSSTEIPGLRFAIHEDHWSQRPENLLTAGVSLASIPQEQIKSYGQAANAVVALCNRTLEGVLTYFAVHAFLVEVARDLKATREELDLSRTSRKTMRTIDCIQRFFDRNAGVPAAVRELCKETESRGFLEHYCGTFTAPRWRQREATREFAKELQEGLNLRAAALIEDESSTREHFEQLCAIVSVRESIRTQFRMEILTVTALIVAAASLLVAVPDTWMAKAMTLIEAIRK